MISVKRSRLLVCIISVLLVAMAVTIADAGILFKSKKQDSRVVKRSVVVFPFDVATNEMDISKNEINANENASEIKIDPYGEEISGYLCSMLSGTKQYALIQFRNRLAPIVRARQDMSLTSDDLKPPFAEGKAKSTKLAQTLASDLYIVGSIEEFRFDAVKKTAQITVAAELVETKTGKSLGKYLVTGTADESSKASEEAEYKAVAAGKAIEALKEKILQPEPKMAPVTAPTAEEPQPPAEPAK